MFIIGKFLMFLCLFRESSLASAESDTNSNIQVFFSYLSTIFIFTN